MSRPRLPHGVRAAVTAVALFVVLTAGLTPSHADSLSSAQARLKALIKKVNAAQRQEAALQADLNALAARISQVQSKMAQTQASIQRTRLAIEAAQSKIDGRQSTIDQRARIEYENGPASTLEFLLSSTSIGDLTDRIQLADAAAQADEDVINQLHTLQNTLHTQQNQLLKLQASLRQQQASLNEQQAAMNQKFLAAKKLYDAAAQAKRKAEAIVHTLKRQAARAAQVLLSGGGFTGGGGGGISISGVLLTCPVAGPHGYTDDFGAPRPGHIHAGVDIQAGTGTPIVAPFPGNATSTYDGGGGNGVIVTGSQGYVYNAHLSRYGTLGHVSTGTVIGYVGSTGDATGPHDHFEWHPNLIPANPYVSPYGYSQVGTAIDPYPYLNSVC